MGYKYRSGFSPSERKELKIIMFFPKEIFEQCKITTPEYGFEPELIYAVCLQEGGKNKDGSFAPDIARLEQGYYRSYVEPMTLATTSEVLLSASYGIMQMIGLSLKEAGFFNWYFDQCTEGMKKLLLQPLSQFAIPNAIDAYCINLKWMIEWGCKWMKTKEKKAKGDTRKMLGYWNGDLSGKYADEVLRKYEKVKKENL